MLTSCMRILVNTVYFVPPKIRKYSARHPDETVIVAGGSKAISLKKNQQVIRGFKWIIAKRAVLILSDKRLVCGSWNIELNQVVDAKLLKISSLFGAALVLMLETSQGIHYQFGLQYDKKWIEQKVLPVKVEQGTMATSRFSRILRIAVWCYVVGWFFNKFNK